MHSSGMRTARLLTVSQHALGRGVFAQVAVCPGGLPRGVWQTPFPPTVNRKTDGCKNITLPQLRCGR